VTPIREICAREYKVTLDTGRSRWPVLLADVTSDLRRLARALRVTIAGRLEPGPTRKVLFLDTPRHDLFHSGRVLRQRFSEATGATELTLKAMSPDRYVLRLRDVRATRPERASTKFEEDISPPFQSRFSLSTTVRLREEEFDGSRVVMRDAVEHFPGLDRLCSGRSAAHLGTPLEPVRGIQVRERVHDGLEVTLGDAHASLAIVVWLHNLREKPLIAELSCRCGVAKRGVSPSVARDAYALFAGIQGMPSSIRLGPTKTQYIYGIRPTRVGPRKVSS